jgi:O-antigen/teichoic acid export membrane protein
VSDKLTEEHLDPTTEISLETVKSRAVKGVVALTGRTFLLKVIALVAQGFLWAFLSPQEFGVFWIVGAIVNFLVYFSDIGLAAALIQKKKKPSENDLKTTFTIQQLLVVGLLIILFLASPVLKRLYSLSNEGMWLMYALGASLFLSSLKSIPSVLLERKLEFGKFVLPQILETFAYNIAVVFFAVKGFGITSFTYAVLIRGVVGLVTIYILQPWLPKFGISRKSLKDLLTFGVPYQINTLLAVLKDDGMTIVLGSILGPAGIGILGTAQRLAQYPLRFFMDNVTKVTFPAFSRMQDEKQHLKRSVPRSIFFICFLVFPSLMGLVILAPILVEVIPKYGKWAPALIPLAFLALNTVFASVTTQLTNLLNAIGKIKVTFKLMIMWTVLTWALVPILSIKFGVIGAAMAYALVGASSVIAIYIARKYVKFSLSDSVLGPGVAAAIMSVTLLLVKNLLPTNLMAVWILIIVGAVSYFLAIYLIVGVSIIADVKKSFSTLFSK